MRFSPKPIFKAIGTFVRRNDTKILKIASYGAIALGTGLVVKGSIEAGAEIQERETELKIEQQDPDAKLSKKDKAKVIAKKVLPGGAMIIGGTIINEVCFRILNKRIIVATAVSEYATAKSLLNTSANNEQKDENGNEKPSRLLTQDRYENLSLDNIEFELYEPITGITIPNMTINKIIVGEWMFNKEYMSFGDVYIDNLMKFFINDKYELRPDKAWKYVWQEYDKAMGFVSFNLTYDDTHHDVILHFSRTPDCLENNLLDKFVS